MNFIKKIKENLQFTGWLQYILTAFLATIVLILALLSWLLINLNVAMPFFLVSAILYGIAVVDIITVKFKVHSQEPLPTRNDDVDLFDLMRIRRSCRSFQVTQLKKEDYSELLSHVALEMTSINKNIDLKDAVRFEYMSKPLTVWPVVNASEFLVAIAPKVYNYNAIINVGRSLQKIVMHATRMGLATCWIGPGADQSSIIEQMGQRFDKEVDHIVCVCAIGYASKHMPFSIRLMRRLQHRRLPISELFFKDKQLKQPIHINEDEFRVYGRCFEICQWAPSSFNGQTTRAVVVKTKSGGTQVDFYCNKKSRFYGPLALGIWCGNWELGCEALNKDGEVVFMPFDSEDNESQSVIQYGVSWKGEKR